MLDGAYFETFGCNGGSSRGVYNIIGYRFNFGLAFKVGALKDYACIYLCRIDGYLYTCAGVQAFACEGYRLTNCFLLISHDTYSDSTFLVIIA